MILRRLIAALALLCAVTPSYGQNTKAGLIAEINTNWATNGTGQLTATLLRTTTIDILNSIMPSAPVTSANLACWNGTTGLLQDCGYAPPFSNSQLAQAPANTVKCNPTGSTANVQDCTGAQTEGVLQFTQSGTGAGQLLLDTKVKQYWATPEDFGAKHDNSTDDSAAIQAALTAIINAGGGTLFLTGGNNCYLTSGTLNINLSSMPVGNRFQGDISIVGSGPQGSCIHNPSTTVSALAYTGSANHDESYFHIENVRITGNSGGSIVSGSIGLFLDAGAWMTMDRVYIEGFDTGVLATDVDQIGWYNSNIRFNNKGFTINASGGITSANNWSFFNVLIAGNNTYGLQCTNCNAFGYFGGSVEVNGGAAGTSGQFGISLIEAGNGGGTVIFDGMLFEGNGGQGDYVSTQTTNPAATIFNSVSFNRISSSIFGTNNIQINGSNTGATYKISGSQFRFFSPYTPSAARPNIGVNNTSAIVVRDGTNYFASPTVEAPQTTVSSCGTSPTIIGNEINGVVVFGTGTPTACTITFGIAYPSPPACNVTWRVNLASMQYSTGTTGITISQTATSSNVIDYHCGQKTGG